MNDNNLVYENKYCKVVYISRQYVIQSKSGKFTDKYCRDLQEVSYQTSIPVKELFEQSMNNLYGEIES